MQTKYLSLLISIGLFIQACGSDDGYGPTVLTGPAGNVGVSPTISITDFTGQFGLCTSGSGVFISVVNPGEFSVSDPHILCSGLNGVNGSNGINGTNGTNGIDSTPLTVVQVCPASFVPSYPSTFPEVVFKLGTKLYGVYSANGGFLVEVTPGTYSSNGINASCTFTVNNDGTLS